jgi:hypothetical protein
MQSKYLEVAGWLEFKLSQRENVYGVDEIGGAYAYLI